MDEYIKREDALDAVLFAMVGTGYQSRAIYAIRNVPAADVAPIAEIAEWIFDEIEGALADNYCGDYEAEYPTPHYSEELSEYIAVLKNKYTGATVTNDGHRNEEEDK